MPPADSPDESSGRTSSTARLYRAYTSGDADVAKGMHPADRADARQILAEVPSLATMAAANVQTLRRAVDAAACAGIDQIIDIGCDVPPEADKPLHASMRVHHPHARSVLIDHDPYVISHAAALLNDAPELTAVLNADARAPEELLEQVRAAGIIDFSRPVCVVLGALLHFVSDTDAAGRGPSGVVQALADAVAPGSWIVCTHVAAELAPEAARATARWYASLGLPGHPRTEQEVRQLMSATEILDPGVVPLADWRPDLHTVRHTPEDAWGFAAVGRVGAAQ